MADNRRNLVKRTGYELDAATLEAPVQREKPSIVKINPRTLPSMADIGFRPVPSAPRPRLDDRDAY